MTDWRDDAADVPARCWVYPALELVPPLPGTILSLRIAPADLARVRAAVLKYFDDLGPGRDDEKT